MSTNNQNTAKDVIKAYLDKRAETDSQFAVAYAKENKSIDECFDYILGEAKKRGTSVCMTDEEVFGLAVHYYDEDGIKINRVTTGYRASTSKAPQPHLSDEEKAAAKERAIANYERLCLEEAAKKDVDRRAKVADKKREKQKEAAAYTPSLFDF